MIARARGVDVSIETCPHYLYFTEEDVERLGAVAKCAPPLRAKCEQNSLWTELLSGDVDIVGSDHSPSPPETEVRRFRPKAGAALLGVQSTLAVLLDRGHHAHGSRSKESVTARRPPATHFRIAKKGRLVPEPMPICDSGCFQVFRSPRRRPDATTSPESVHRSALRGAVQRTIRRGETIFNQGRLPREIPAYLLRPAKGRNATSRKNRSAHHADHLLQNPDTFVRAAFQNA